ncbi:hypothetical protein [Candidatus Tisiphia endosymbiont of Nemotelus uliginosus]|uniref:hypothetical protein n=1 Tax=Candidatus Tisiphia endosymbiont of Nemotelus uliginosus TaxID=3077926 RepID=UPI0035C8C990
MSIRGETDNIQYNCPASWNNWFRAIYVPQEAFVKGLNRGCQPIDITSASNIDASDLANIHNINTLLHSQITNSTPVEEVAFISNNNKTTPTSNVIIVVSAVGGVMIFSIAVGIGGCINSYKNKQERDDIDLEKGDNTNSDNYSAETTTKKDAKIYHAMNFIQKFAEQAEDSPGLSCVEDIAAPNDFNDMLNYHGYEVCTNGMDSLMNPHNN